MVAKHRPALYLAISRHGYGHATRLASVAAEVQRLLPDVRLVFAGLAPHELLAAYVPGPFEQRHVVLDAGVSQPDSLIIDLEGTHRQARRIRQRQHEIVSREVAFVRHERIGLILADIPPLAAVIGEAAGVPCWMVSNFGWDYIYGGWGPAFEGIACWVQDCYALCDQLFRLPFHEPMAVFPSRSDVGLTGGQPRWPAERLASQLGIKTPRERTALVTLGGFGRHQLPYDAMQSRPDWTFLVFDPQAPAGPNIIPRRDTVLRPVDLLPVCGRLIAKPGFSTFSEAIRLGVPIVTMPRPDFAEAEILVTGMAAVHPHQLVDLDSFLAGDWSFLDRAPDPPPPGAAVDKWGTEAIARAVVAALSG